MRRPRSSIDPVSRNATDVKAPAAKPVAPVPDAPDWYLAKTPNGSVRQAVINVPPSNTVATKFGTIWLEYDQFPMLASGTWCAGFFRLDGDPGPYLMLRVDDFIEDLKRRRWRWRFRFARHRRGLCSSYPPDLNRRRWQRPCASSFPNSRRSNIRWPNGSRAWIRNIDVDLIDGALSRDRIHMVLARNSKSSKTVFSDSGQRKLTLPQAVCNIVVPLDPAIASCLRAEWNALLAQHNSIPNSELNFNQAQRELAAQPCRSTKTLSCRVLPCPRNRNALANLDFCYATPASHLSRPRPWSNQ